MKKGKPCAGLCKIGVLLIIAFLNKVKEIRNLENDFQKAFFY
jgi:hypothetical protein